MAGRPSKYTPEVTNRILNAISAGAPFVHACRAARISEDTFARWRSEYPEFAEAVKEAEGRAVVSSLETIRSAAEKGSWQASAWLLERRYPKDFGRREHVELTETNKHESDIAAAKAAYQRKYQELAGCTEAEARRRAEEAFAIADQPETITDETSRQAS